MLSGGPPWAHGAVVPVRTRGGAPQHRFNLVWTLEMNVQQDSGACSTEGPVMLGALQYSKSDVPEISVVLFRNTDTSPEPLPRHTPLRMRTRTHGS